MVKLKRFLLPETYQIYHQDDLEKISGKINIRYGQWFITPKTDELITQSKVERSLIETKYCLECPPQEIKKLVWSYETSRGSAFDPDFYTTQDSVLVIPSEKFRLFRGELIFKYNDKKMNEIKKDIMKRANKPVRMLKQVEKLESISIEASHFKEDMDKLNKCLYEYVYFTLCAKHSKTTQETLEKIVGCLFSKSPLKTSQKTFGPFPEKAFSSPSGNLYTNFSQKEIKYRISKSSSITDLSKNSFHDLWTLKR